MLSVHQFEHLKTGEVDSKQLYEGMKKVVAAVNAIAKQTNTDPSNQVDAPGAITSISVVGANGVADIAIVDNSAGQRRGLNYFVEYSTTPDFAKPTVIQLGASRNWRVFLGNLTLYFRGYSQYFGSQPSGKVPFGSPAAAVNLGGAIAGPTPQPSQGSGTGGGGFGNTYYPGYRPA